MKSEVVHLEHKVCSRTAYYREESQGSAKHTSFKGVTELCSFLGLLHYSYLGNLQCLHHEPVVEEW